MRILKATGLHDFDTTACVLLWIIGHTLNGFVLSFATGWSIGYIIDLFLLSKFRDKI